MVCVTAFQKQLLPPPESFYEKELLRLSRPSRGWSKAICPFHPDKHPSLSVNLDSGGFFCFSCQAKGGDVVDFIRLRDRCDFKTACKLLGCWQDVSREERLKLASEATMRKQNREKAVRIKKAEQTRRIELRDEIHTLVEIQAEVSDRLSQLRRVVAPAYENEAEDCWSVLSRPVIA